MRFRSRLFSSILCFLSLVLFILAPDRAASAIDAAALYAAKKEAIVVIINERTDTPEDLEKEEERFKNRPRFFPKKDADPAFTAPPLYTYVLSNAEGRATVYATGTGFIIKEDGLVVTSAHIVRNSKTLTIETASGELFQADILGVDTSLYKDIALLKIRSAKTFPTLKIKAKDQLFVGKRLVVIGHPLLYKHTMSEAMVSKLRVVGGQLSLIQIYSSILPGNSGSPLLDEQGEAVGIIYGTLINSETQGLAVPAETMQSVIDRLLEKSSAR